MWKFINTGYSPGALNMAYDERLVRLVAASDLHGIVRVYGWDPPCISLGFHQDLRRVNVEKCREIGVDLVRRPTGGRAILHWDEVTYSVVRRVSGESLSEVYCSIGSALVNALRRLHPEIALARLGQQNLSLDRPTSNVPCYSGIARYEIQYRGRKIVGSAQRRYSFPSEAGDLNVVVLQHGSILFGPSHLRIVEFLNTENPDSILRMKTDLAERSIDLSTILGRSVTFEEVAECVKDGFESEWGIEFSRGDSQKDFPIETPAPIAS